MTNFETKWEKFSFDYKNIVESKCEESNIKTFFGSSILSTNLALICIIDIVKNFKLKIYNFDESSFNKKLFKKTRKEMYKLYNFFLIDYFILLSDHLTYQKYLKENNLIPEEFEAMIFDILSFTKEEKKSFKEYKKKKDTVSHTVKLLEELGLGKESRNEAIVDAVEIIKNEFYRKFDENIEKFLYKK